MSLSKIVGATGTTGHLALSDIEDVPTICTARRLIASRDIYSLTEMLEARYLVTLVTLECRCVRADSVDTHHWIAVIS